MPDRVLYPLSIPRTVQNPLPGARLAALAALTAGLVVALSVLPGTLAGREPESAPAQAMQAEAFTVVMTVDEGALEAVAPPPVAAEASVPVAETSSAVAAAPAIAGAPASVETAAGIAVPQPAAGTSAPAGVASEPAPLAVPAAPTAGARWLEEGFVFVQEAQEWDEASRANVEGALSALPAGIRAQLGNRALGPVHILVNRAGRSLSGKQPYGGPANYFSTNDSRNELVLFPGQSVQTILHELGHAYNLRRIAAGRYSLVLLDPQMQSFMAATGWRVLSTPEQIRAARDHIQVEMAYEGQQVWSRLSHHDPLEDFANSFAMYFLSPSELESRSPERFAWFEANVGR